MDVYLFPPGREQRDSTIRGRLQGVLNQHLATTPKEGAAQKQVLPHEGTREYLVLGTPSLRSGDRATPGRTIERRRRGEAK